MDQENNYSNIIDKYQKIEDKLKIIYLDDHEEFVPYSEKKRTRDIKY